MWSTNKKTHKRFHTVDGEPITRMPKCPDCGDYLIENSCEKCIMRKQDEARIREDYEIDTEWSDDDL